MFSTKFFSTSPLTSQHHPNRAPPPFLPWRLGAALAAHAGALPLRHTREATAALDAAVGVELLGTE